MNERLSEIERLLDEVLEMEIPKDLEHKHVARETLDRIIRKLSIRLGANYVLERIIRSDEPQIYNLMTSPFAGRPRQEIIEFIKKEFKGSSTIEIFDAYFFNSTKDNKENYLDFLVEIKEALEELHITEVIIHYVDRKDTIKIIDDVEKIFVSSIFSFTKRIDYQDYLHDRLWLGYKLIDNGGDRIYLNMIPSPVGVYFGSSFNNVFQKPMFYNPINDDDIKNLLSCFREISSLNDGNHDE